MTQHQCRYPHVPECRHLIHGYFIFKTDDFPDADPCDDKLCGHCDMLRACEQRVRTAMHTAEREEYLNGLYEGRNDGYAAGLAAARDAVAAVEDYPGELFIDKAKALAAIDALRGER